MTPASRPRQVVQLPVRSRRRHMRMCCAPTLAYLHLPEDAAPLDAHIVEVSKGGIQIRIDRDLPVGARLTLDTGHLTVVGTVRHCERTPEHFYLAGVEMEEVQIGASPS